MKQEILRMDRVTYRYRGETELHNFCLNIFAGEIMGLVPVNSTGLNTLMKLLVNNLPLHYGYVYYRERLVNNWLEPATTTNRISIIGSRNVLVDDLSVADNVFVLRPGFRKYVMSRKVLGMQLQPFLHEIGVEIAADACVRDLSPFQQFVVALVRAVVAGNRLVVLRDVSNFLSDTELKKLHEILRHYAKEGMSFLYICLHSEEVQQLCTRTAYMINGQVVKLFDTAHIPPDTINLFCGEEFGKLVNAKSATHAAAHSSTPVLEVHNLCFGAIQGLDFSVARGECVVIQDMDNSILQDSLRLLTCEQRPVRGEISMNHIPFTKRSRRSIAVIQEMATETMLFSSMSYVDNLCFTMDHRLPSVWRRRKLKTSIRKEYMQRLGSDIFDKHVDELSEREKYDLIYARILLQRPDIVFCVQPFMQAGAELRVHIWKLLETFLEKGIAVVILAVNLADALSLADRLLTVQDGRVYRTYDRSEFGVLPANIPWRLSGTKLE